MNEAQPRRGLRGSTVVGVERKGYMEEELRDKTTQGSEGEENQGLAPRSMVWKALSQTRNTNGAMEGKLTLGHRPKALKAVSADEMGATSM